MDRPIHALFVGFVVGSFSITQLHAAESDAPAKRERAVSPRMAAMLSAALPKYADSPAASSPTPANASRATPERITPANAIVRLPDYIVPERKPAPLPKPVEVMTARELEKVALDEFLGEGQGLNRALSVLTPVHLWRMIPLLGKFPLVTFETNEQRAMGLYRKAREKERADYLNSPEFRPSVPNPPKNP